MLTNEIHFDTRLYLQSGGRKGEIALYKQSNYPNSEPVLLGTFTEAKSGGGIELVLEAKDSIKLKAKVEPVEVKAAEADEGIPF